MSAPAQQPPQEGSEELNYYSFRSEHDEKERIKGLLKHVKKDAPGCFHALIIYENAKEVLLLYSNKSVDFCNLISKEKNISQLLSTPGNYAIIDLVSFSKEVKYIDGKLSPDCIRAIRYGFMKKLVYNKIL